MEAVDDQGAMMNILYKMCCLSADNVEALKKENWELKSQIKEVQKLKLKDFVLFVGHSR